MMLIQQRLCLALLAHEYNLPTSPACPSVFVSVTSQLAALSACGAHRNFHGNIQMYSTRQVVLNLVAVPTSPIALYKGVGEPGIAPSAMR
jgi:hypothetical protein